MGWVGIRDRLQDYKNMFLGCWSGPLVLAAKTDYPLFQSQLLLLLQDRSLQTWGTMLSAAQQTYIQSGNYMSFQYQLIKMNKLVLDILQCICFTFNIHICPVHNNVFAADHAATESVHQPSKHSTDRRWIPQ